MPALKPDTDVARSFIAWGGFHEMKPIPAETPLPTSQLFRSDGIDQARMRRALRDYSAMLHESSPFETFKDFDSSKESTLTPVLDWEPLPGHESTTTDTPMPSAIHAEVAQKELHTLEAILTPKPTIAPAATSETSSTTITVEVAQETPGPATPLPVAPKMPASVVEAEAIAARITQSPIRPPKQKQKQKQKNKKPQAPTTARPTQQPPPQKSLREIRNEALQARQSEFAKREQAKAEEPQTVKSKLSSFFGSIF
ncbi:hypothetical protein H0H81_008008 [Sphagnurus paluster]|uniref:Uncharacterized protein n=1 Tax=Sphagnurus paluster TaxID=117069 RepID=A0A9P7KLI9_9AGAR|nr:hypothetical protein H0H81_008008 [Sphagnurus paluster]